MSKVAARIETPEYRVRRHINGGLGLCNVSDYLNEHRIAEVRSALAALAGRRAAPDERDGCQGWQPRDVQPGAQRTFRQSPQHVLAAASRRLGAPPSKPAYQSFSKMTGRFRGSACQDRFKSASRPRSQRDATTPMISIAPTRLPSKLPTKLIIAGCPSLLVPAALLSRSYRPDPTPRLLTWSPSIMPADRPRRWAASCARAATLASGPAAGCSR
ncbi:hypothetical protein C8J47_2946 [Sphingomonas sp. PP-F2F-G114-C0414]|nr:hypothetical protein C8J47_2946 [Sphingomonas sp. PP-F2F-G114-C0414]